MLRASADAVAGHSREAGDVPDALRAQAVHVEQGGEAATSPLRPASATAPRGLPGPASGSSLTDL